MFKATTGLGRKFLVHEKEPYTATDRHSGAGCEKEGHTNLILCFSESAGLICSKVKKKK